MKLRDFLEGKFDLFWWDDQDKAMIRGVDLAVNKPVNLSTGVDDTQPFLLLPKKELANGIMEYAKEKGHEALETHPAKFMQDLGYDLYRGFARSNALKTLNKWLQ